MPLKIKFGEYKGGSKPETGNISDRALTRVFGIPSKTIADWKKRENENYRKKIYLFLKEYTEEEILEILEKINCT
jgi:hypothetical protein